MSIWDDFVRDDFLTPVRALVREHVLTVADQLDRDDVYPGDVIKTLSAHGLNSITLPKRYGGQEEDYRVCVALFEEIGWASASVAISMITNFQAQNIILRSGTDSLKDRFLPEFPKGMLASYALTETAHGSDIRSLDTTAKRDGDAWIIRGQKSFITSGVGAELFVILAQTDVGVSVFAVPRDTKGVSTYKGPNSETFGLRNGPHVELVLEDVRVPFDHLIGEEGKGLKQILINLNYSRALNGAVAMGIARAAFEGALAHAKARKAFDQTIFDFQGIQWYFADMLTDIDAARLLLYRSADALDSGKDIDRYSSEAKLKCTEVAHRVTERAMQVCGAYGTMVNAPFNRYFRDSKIFQISGGSSEILRNTISRFLKSADLGSQQG